MATRYDDQDGLPYSKKSKQQYLSDRGDTRFIERAAIAQVTLLSNPDEARFLIEAPSTSYYDQKEGYNNAFTPVQCWEEPHERTGWFPSFDHHGHPDEGLVVVKVAENRLSARTISYGFKWDDRRFHPRMSWKQMEHVPDSIILGCRGGPVDRLISHRSLDGKGLILQELHYSSTQRHCRYEQGRRQAVVRITVKRDLLSLDEAYAEIERIYNK